MDTFDIEVKDDGSGIVVTTGVTVAEDGGLDNPSRVKPYNNA
jgi:hypothetical protein